MAGLNWFQNAIDVLLEFETLLGPTGLAPFLMGNGEHDVAPVGCSLRELVERAETQVHALNPLAVLSSGVSAKRFDFARQRWSKAVGNAARM